MNQSYDRSLFSWSSQSIWNRSSLYSTKTWSHFSRIFEWWVYYVQHTHDKKLCGYYKHIYEWRIWWRGGRKERASKAYFANKGFCLLTFKDFASFIKDRRETEERLVKSHVLFLKLYVFDFYFWRFSCWKEIVSNTWLQSQIWK